jgi:hypothetical protein
MAVAVDRQFAARFGRYRWCWPRDSLDLLLKAALASDHEFAQAQARKWLDRHDIAAASFRDHRLLTAVAGRFNTALADHLAYPRLVGLRRQLWTKSRMAAHQAAPVLHALADAGVPLLLTKGASRVAVDAAAATVRMAQDIDVVVGPENLETAFSILARSGWQPASGASIKRLAARLYAIQSINFFHGRAGDIDLHRDAYPGERDEADEARMWRHSEGATFHDIAVLVPGPVDRATIAIAHGALAAHVHSDWIIDCAIAMSEAGFSWTALLEIVARRHLWVPATAALSYLSFEIGCPVPVPVLDQLVTAADRIGPLLRLASLLEAKPRTDASLAVHVARWVAKKARQKRERRSRESAASEPTVMRGRRLYRFWRSRLGKASPFATSHSLHVPPKLPSGARVRLSVVVEIAVPSAPRRIEMEVNSTSRHIAQLRYRQLRKQKGLIRVRYAGDVRLGPADSDLAIEARPIRQVREMESAAAFLRWGALPFRVVAAQISGNHDAAKFRAGQSRAMSPPAPDDVTPG